MKGTLREDSQCCHALGSAPYRPACFDSVEPALAGCPGIQSKSITCAFDVLLVRDLLSKACSLSNLSVREKWIKYTS